MSHPIDLFELQENLRSIGCSETVITGAYQALNPGKLVKFIEEQCQQQVFLIQCRRHPGNLGSPACAVWGPYLPHGLIFIEELFLEVATQPEIDFVIGHEIGHLTPIGQQLFEGKSFINRMELEFYCDAIASQYIGSRDQAIAALDRMDDICFQIARNFGIEPAVSLSTSGKKRLDDWASCPTELRIEMLKKGITTLEAIAPNKTNQQFSLLP
jgi:hypothetical protein